MRQVVLIALAFLMAAVVPFGAKTALSQGATVQIRPDIPPRTDVIYPDAVICNAVSPQRIVHQLIFYKSQTVSFSTELNNIAEYGTPPFQSQDSADPAIQWRLQLGKPGSIIAFPLPSGWTTDNCPIGKLISQLISDKQALKIFAPENNPGRP
jgi:hypothetical protein